MLLVKVPLFVAFLARKLAIGLTIKLPQRKPV